MNNGIFNTGELVYYVDQSHRKGRVIGKSRKSTKDVPSYLVEYPNGTVEEIVWWNIRRVEGKW